MDPTMHPLSMLPTIAEVIDGELDCAEDHYKSLLAARPTPHVLDDATIERSIKLANDQMELLPKFREQLQFWGKANPSANQIQEILRLGKVLTKLLHVLAETLALAEEISKGTIEKVLSRPDGELGIEALERRGIKVDENLTPEQVYAVIDEVRKEHFGADGLKQTTGTKGGKSTFVSDKHLKIASKIDARVRKLQQAGKNDVEIFVDLVDLMPSFHTLISRGERVMDELCARFGGFCYYAQILSGIAEGIASGEIEVPK